LLVGKGERIPQGGKGDPHAAGRRRGGDSNRGGGEEFGVFGRNLQKLREEVTVRMKSKRGGGGLSSKLVEKAVERKSLRALKKKEKRKERTLGF